MQKRYTYSERIALKEHIQRTELKNNFKEQDYGKADFY